MKFTFKRFSFDSSQVDIIGFFRQFLKLGWGVICFLAKMIGGLLLMGILLMTAAYFLSFAFTWVLIALFIFVAASLETKFR